MGGYHRRSSGDQDELHQTTGRQVNFPERLNAKTNELHPGNHIESIY